jgi:hypothetical protein
LQLPLYSATSIPDLTTLITKASAHKATKKQQQKKQLK